MQISYQRERQRQRMLSYKLRITTLLSPTSIVILVTTTAFQSNQEKPTIQIEWRIEIEAYLCTEPSHVPLSLSDEIDKVVNSRHWELHKPDVSPFTRKDASQFGRGIALADRRQPEQCLGRFVDSLLDIQRG